MGASEELQEARRALAQLERSVEGIRRRHGDTADVRRLARDVRCIGESLDEIEPPAPAAPAQRVLEVIPDTEYTPPFEDCDDEGVGFAGRTVEHPHQRRRFGR